MFIELSFSGSLKKQRTKTTKHVSNNWNLKNKKVTAKENSNRKHQKIKQIIRKEDKRKSFANKLEKVGDDTPKISKKKHKSNLRVSKGSSKKTFSQIKNISFAKNSTKKGKVASL